MTPSLRKHPRPSQWLVFTEDGGVEVLTGKVEIGQALHAALAGWVAGSLSWPVERVRVVIACAARALRADACCRLYGAEMRHPGVEKDVTVLWCRSAADCHVRAFTVQHA